METTAMQKSSVSRRNVVKGGLGLVAAGGIAQVARAQEGTPGTDGYEATPASTESASTPMALQPGELTAKRSFLIAIDSATLEITPIITAGETVADYQMAGVPDGLGAYKDGDDVVLFMNHELTPSDNENASFARVSRLVLDGTTGAVKSGTYALDGTEGYERLCSASLAGSAEGFDTPVFMTGEESTSGEFGGMSLAIDGATSEVTQLPWLGHVSHENVLAVPGFDGKTVVVTTDDDSKGSELYLYIADSPADLLAGNGQLYVFKSDTGANTGDIKKGDDLTGSFVPVDQGDNPDQQTLQEAVKGMGAFTFVRLEDVTYDRNTTTTIYFADTGDDADPNLDSSGQPYTKNGRIYSMTLDPSAPTKVTSFSVLLDGDAGDDIKNPDNLDTSKTTLMICEDRNGYNRAENSDDTGRILAYDFASGKLTAIAKIDQSDGSGVLDEGDKAGSWESSGILNVSDLFGDGVWLADVQAHSIKVAQFGTEDESGQLLMLRQK